MRYILFFVLLSITHIHLFAQDSQRPEWSYKTGVIADGQTSYLKVYSFFANGRTEAYEKLKEVIEQDRRTAMGVRKDDDKSLGFIYSYQELGMYMEIVAHGGMYYFLVQVCKTYSCHEWEKVDVSSAKYISSPADFSRNVIDNTPRPSWVKNALFPPHDAGYILVWGEGISSAPNLAKNYALADAVKKGLYELHAEELTTQNIQDIEVYGFNAVANCTNRAIKELCQSDPVYLNENRCKVYVLIQMQIDKARNANFYQTPPSFTSCEDRQFSNEVKNWNAQIMKAVDKRNRKRHRGNMLHGYSYLGGILASVGYPFNLKVGFTGRHGGVLGIGYSLMVGAGFKEHFSFSSPIDFNCVDERYERFYKGGYSSKNKHTCKAGVYYSLIKGREHNVNSDPDRWDYSSQESDGVQYFSAEKNNEKEWCFTYSIDLKLYLYKHLYVGGRLGRVNFGDIEYYDQDLKLTKEDVTIGSYNKFIESLSKPTGSILLGFQRVQRGGGFLFDVNVSATKNPITDKLAFMAQCGIGFGCFL